MNDWTLTVLTRAIERILDVGAGILAVYLGFRLFLAMPDVDRAKGEIKLPGGVSIYVSRVGPGVFFAAFGAILIGLSFTHPVIMSEKGAGAPAEAGAQIAAGPVQERHWSSLGTAEGQGRNTVKDAAERNDVLRIVAGLNGTAEALRGDLPVARRVPLDNALHDAKLRLMQSVWDSARWGDFARFSAWVRDHANEPPPADLAQPVEYFRAGSR